MHGWCDAVLLQLGFKTKLGPLKEWGFEIEKGALVVDPLMRTNLDRVWACGDITTFDGKLKLIATGFAEAAIAVAQAVHHIRPGDEDPARVLHQHRRPRRVAGQPRDAPRGCPRRSPPGVRRHRLGGDGGGDGAARGPGRAGPERAAGEGPRRPRPAGVGVPGDRRQDAAGARRRDRRRARDGARRLGLRRRPAEPRRVRRDRQTAGFLYGKTALYVARSPKRRPRAVRRARRRAGDRGALPLAAGRDRGRPVRRRLRGPGAVRKPGQLRGDGGHARRRQAGRRARPARGHHQGAGQDPEVGEPAPKVRPTPRHRRR